MYGFSYPNQGRISRRDCTKGEPFAELSLKLFYNIVSITGNPIINIISTSKEVISDEVSVTSSQIVFSCDQAIESWEARATIDGVTPGVGVGFLVGSGGAISASQSISFDVDYTELTQGDVFYTITVYVQIAGVWY